MKHRIWMGMLLLSMTVVYAPGECNLTANGENRDILTQLTLYTYSQLHAAINNIKYSTSISKQQQQRIIEQLYWCIEMKADRDALGV